MQRKNWDIFCKVIDNFGDIGFCWRLAQQLETEHNRKVCLWVDDLASLKRLCPEIDLALAEQTQHGINVRHWLAPFPQADVADVVIEAFACELPEIYLAAMAAQQKKPAWINLEYLSAENWVGDSHGLASPHPRLPLTKYFYFPGFTTNTGGLLREKTLIQERTDWQAKPDKIWQYFDLPPEAPEEVSISLFCYKNPALPKLLRCWATGNIRIRCLVPEGRALEQIAESFEGQSMAPGASFRQGNLRVHALPFLSQESYDRLLWSCDLNFVRGEDSFVRAQWSARPFVWQIYPQELAAHHAKLEAFLERYCAQLKDSENVVFRQFWHSWNGIGRAAIDQSWQNYWQYRETLAVNATQWATRLAEAENLASRLVLFCENLL